MTKKEEFIFKHYETDLQLIHNKLVQIISEVDRLFNSLDKLKKNLNDK